MVAFMRPTRSLTAPHSQVETSGVAGLIVTSWCPASGPRVWSWAVVVAGAGVWAWGWAWGGGGGGSASPGALGRCGRCWRRHGDASSCASCVFCVSSCGARAVRPRLQGTERESGGQVKECWNCTLKVNTVGLPNACAFSFTVVPFYFNQIYCINGKCIVSSS